MRYVGFGFALPLVAFARLSLAQGIPVTVTQAEADGAVFLHDAPPAALQPAFAQPPVGGSSVERKCVAPLSDVPTPLGSWRSGEFVIRAQFTGPGGLRAGKGSKVLWMPLHDPGRRREQVVIRAARLEHPSDSLRLTFPGVARSISHTEFGFPSTVIFPAAGQWLAVVTMDHDWGCFLLNVVE